MDVFCVVAEAVVLVLVRRVDEAAEEGRGEDDVLAREVGGELVAADVVADAADEAADASDDAADAMEDCALDDTDAMEESALEAGGRADESSVNGREVAGPETEGIAAEVVPCEGCTDIATDDCGGAGMPGVYEG